MTFEKLEVDGCYLVRAAVHQDERGSYTKYFSRDEYEARGLETGVGQLSRVLSARAGTLRGLHWQEPPHAEAKLVQCLRGAIFDVVVDLRPGSPGRLRWCGVVLKEGDDSALYVPPQCAHGFLALEDDTEVLYSSSSLYDPESERGLRYDDPAVGIVWPLEVSDVSKKDRNWPDLS